MENLYKLQDLVEETLSTYPQTRDSDMLLYVTLACRIENIEKIEVVDKPFAEVLTHLKDYHLPPIESVTRARRKAQEQHPELKSCNDVEAMRDIREEHFVEYARG